MLKPVTGGGLTLSSLKVTAMRSIAPPGGAAMLDAEGVQIPPYKVVVAVQEVHLYSESIREQPLQKG